MRVVQYSQIDSIGVSGDKKGLHYGKFTLARQELKKVALKADSINYEMRWRTTFRENIKLTMKLFDALTDLP